MEKVTTHILCPIIFFRKSCRLGDNVEKYCGDKRHKLRHNMSHTLCLRDKQGYIHSRGVYTPTRPGNHTHTHKHARSSAHTHTHTYSQIHNTYCFSTSTIIRERASKLRYTYIACYFFYKIHLTCFSVS
jgi:hypothetical protein